MSMNNSDNTSINKHNHTDHVKGEIAPLFVSLAKNDPLPSDEYVRVVALSGPGSIDNSTKTLKTSDCVVNDSYKANGAHPLAVSMESSVIRHDFALHLRGARFCRLLETMLDVSDLNMGFCASVVGNNGVVNKAGRKEGDGVSVLPDVVLPQATLHGCKALFVYLDMITSRVPSTLSKPLRAPLEELVQPWEMMFLLKHCMDETTSRAIFEEVGGEKESCVSADSKSSYYHVILNGAPNSLNLLLELAMLSDFLLVEPLRQLTCAFIASLALSASSATELLQLCGLERAMTEEELSPVYAQFPFLRPEDNSEW